MMSTQYLKGYDMKKDIKISLPNEYAHPLYLIRSNSPTRVNSSDQRGVIVYADETLMAMNCEDWTPRKGEISWPVECDYPRKQYLALLNQIKFALEHDILTTEQIGGIITESFCEINSLPQSGMAKAIDRLAHKEMCESNIWYADEWWSSLWTFENEIPDLHIDTETKLRNWVKQNHTCAIQEDSEGNRHEDRSRWGDGMDIVETVIGIHEYMLWVLSVDSPDGNPVHGTSITLNWKEIKT